MKKTIETRVEALRRAAEKIGLGIQKKGDGYMIYDLRGNYVVAGGEPEPFFLSLDEAEKEISDRAKKSGNF